VYRKGRLGCARGRMIKPNDEWRTPPPWLIAIILVELYILLSLAFVVLENKFGSLPGCDNSGSLNAPPKCRERGDLFVGAPD